MTNYTVLTVFENTDTINEPVISMPMLGKISFRQIGIIVGLVIMLPMMIYSGSEAILDVFGSGAVFSFVAVNSEIKITWDVVIALVPIPFGLFLGVPRPKLVPMDRLIFILFNFMIHHTSVKSVTSKKRSKSVRRPKTNSKFAGFAQKDYSIKPDSKVKNVHSVSVTDLNIPKNITITIYDLEGHLLRNKLARAYIDDVLLSSITTDADGVIGMTFIPKNEGMKNLKIVTDGVKEPVVDVMLDVKKNR